MPESEYPVMKGHVPEEQNPQLHCSKKFKICTDKRYSSTIQRINPNGNNPIPTPNRINNVPAGGKIFLFHKMSRPGLGTI